MKQLIDKLKKNWTRVWLVVIALACCSFVGIAAYTEVSSVKRVVSTTSSPGDPFSSNCMKTTIVSRHLTATEFPVSICNFDQDYPKNWSTSEITYTLEAELKVKVNNDYKTFSELYALIGTEEGQITQATYDSYVAQAKQYTILKTQDDANGVVATAPTVSEGEMVNFDTFNSTNSYKVTFPADTLEENKSSTDQYTVVIPESDLHSEDALFFVFVTAKPAGGVLSNLSARLYGSETKDDEAASWNGSILESDYATVDYDFYNYVITGSGVGKIDVLWDTRQIKINKYALEAMGLTAATVASDNALYGDDGSKGHFTGYSIVTINGVDSREKPRYEFQLYKVGEGTIHNPDDYIECFFTQTTSNQSNQS